MTHPESLSKVLTANQYQNWMKVDNYTSARLSINNFIQSYKHLKNQKKLLYSSLSDLNLNSFESDIINYTPIKLSLRLIGKLIITCSRWSTWARHNYNRNLHRYISFTQFYELNDKGESKFRITENEITSNDIKNSIGLNISTYLDIITNIL